MVSSTQIQATSVANRDTKQDYVGGFLSFNLNLNWPPGCSTGFLPPQQQRAPSFEACSISLPILRASGGTSDG